MKSRNKLWILTIFIAFAFPAAASHAQTTAFTYQGSLTDGGSPANGNFQMQFKLYDAPAGGAQVGSTLNDVAVNVSNGTFSTKLDFGSAPFSGANRWLEIAVRRNATESYVTLSPREQIASSPYAVRTLSAAMADDSQKLGGVAASEYVTTATVGNSFIRNGTQQQTANFNISGNGVLAGQLGINTGINPNFHVDIQGGTRSYSPASAHFVAETIGGTNSWARFYMRSPSRSWFIGTSQNFNGNQFYLADETGGQTRFSIQPAGGAISFPFGSVGIGTTNPQSGLELRGTGAQTQQRITDDTSGNSLVLQAGAGGNMKITGYNYGSSTAVPIHLSVDGANTIMNTAGGNVGIGTTTPNGKLTVIGNATQDLFSSGFPKAMVYVNGDGTMFRCYNGTNGSSTGGCGFTSSRSGTGSGSYRINFGFQVNNRFWATSVDGGCCTTSVSLHVSVTGTNTLDVYILTNSAVFTDRPFMLIVY